MAVSAAANEGRILNRPDVNGRAGFLSKGWIICDLCRADENYFHTAECVYDQLVSEYPVMWLRDSTRIGASYTLRELLSPEGMVLAIQNPLAMKGWRLRMRYNEAIDGEINPQHGYCVELPSRSDALQTFVGTGYTPLSDNC